MTFILYPTMNVAASGPDKEIDHHDSWEEKFDKEFLISNGVGIDYYQTLDPTEIKSFIRSTLARQHESFLTMLPPEKKFQSNLDYEDGWNDYRRELLANMDKHDSSSS